MFVMASGLSAPSGFVPRATSDELDTQALLTWIHVGGDLFSWLALLSFPLILLYFFRRREMERPWLTILITAFILAAAFEHFIDALTFHYPLFRLAGYWKLFTALLSWATVLALISVVP